MPIGEGPARGKRGRGGGELISWRGGVEKRERGGSGWGDWVRYSSGLGLAS